jgi:hypothetical protein
MVKKRILRNISIIWHLLKGDFPKIIIIWHQGSELDLRYGSMSIAVSVPTEVPDY